MGGKHHKPAYLDAGKKKKSGFTPKVQYAGSETNSVPKEEVK